MSKFKLICEDDTIPFGPSKISHEFDTEDLFTVLGNITKFLQSAGYVDKHKRLNLEREIDLNLSEDLDEFTKNLFNKPLHETKYGKLQPYNDYVRSDDDAEKWAKNYYGKD